MAPIETSQRESAPMRKVWVVNETSISNPWLARNLSPLGDALHVEIELVEQEAWIGGYNGDILTDDKKGDAAIIIERRSDQTDRHQLGDSLARAENYDARILIWIANNFREEHRSALDWLNRWTPEDIEVYGVERRSTEKDDADTNPEFVPVVAPASWSKHGESRPIPNIHSVVLREFFQALNDDLSATEFKGNQRVVTKYDQSFSSGFSEVDFHASFESDRKVWVYVSTSKQPKSRLFGPLREKNQEIENKLNLASDSKTEIDWYTAAGNIGVWRAGSLNDSEEELRKIRKWMLEYLIKFRKVFNPRMQRIIAELENSDK